MREETDSNSHGEATDSHSTIKDSYSKKRAIRKERIQNGNEKKIDDGICRPTREQRAKIQKEKNRQAAQRSRDLHREYVTNLQKEVHDLKHQLQNSKKLCYRCNQPLDPHQVNFFGADNSMANDEFPVHCSFQKENELQIVGLQMEKRIVGGSDNDYLVRVEDNHEESSYIALMLMVGMVAIVVIMSIHTGGKIQAKDRGLLEVYPIQSPASNIEEIQTLEKGVDEQIKNGDSLGLIQWRGSDNDICLDSLMGVSPSIIKSSLRRIHSSQYEIDSGVLVCSYKMPKIYSVGVNNSPLVKMFVLGSQIKEMLTTSGALQHHVDKNIQLNGIYRLSAEIKSVDLVTQHNCLL